MEELMKSHQYKLSQAQKNLYKHPMAVKCAEYSKYDLQLNDISSRHEKHYDKIDTNEVHTPLQQCLKYMKGH